MQKEFNRRKGQFKSIAGGGIEVVVAASQREGNSGGTGPGMQHRSQEGFADTQLHMIDHGDDINAMADISPMDIHEPIDGILISDAEKLSAPLLRIRILEGIQEMIGHQILINAQGLVSSKRNKKDGCTIFGSQEQNQQSGEYYNDFVIANSDLAPESGTQISNGGIGKRHMVIKYNQLDKKYYLRDLGDGSGTFIRIDNQKDLILKHGFIISFGDSHMVVQFSSEMVEATQKVSQKITLKFLDGPKIDKEFTFTEAQAPIKIGRMSSCQIKFDDNSLSRLQCQIEFRHFDPENHRYGYYN